MKKLKKIKIIEDGRICSPEEMNSIRGGYTCPGAVYTSCENESKYTTCREMPSVTGYSIDDDGKETCSIGYIYITCTGDYNYGGCSSKKEFES